MKIKNYSFSSSSFCFLFANCQQAASISSHIVALIVETTQNDSKTFWNYSIINLGVGL